uniref:Uncharacterized protein n=1 Tax=Siphoviridae sp. ctwHj1 TaxID=2825727 RepID=A0A8S5U651_9CAUD|nr:MAG TPA: hypothetical protein [Siphoviridae sp. ctwHj1]
MSRRNWRLFCCQILGENFAFSLDVKVNFTYSVFNETGNEPRQKEKAE